MKANRTRRGFSLCCMAAALLMMGSDIMRGLAQEEHRLWICATAKSCSRTRQEKMNFTLHPMAPDAIFMPLEKRSRRSCLGC